MELVQSELTTIFLLSISRISLVVALSGVTLATGVVLVTGVVVGEATVGVIVGVMVGVVLTGTVGSGVGAEKEVLLSMATMRLL